MSRTITRYLRLHCQFPGAIPQQHRDGVLAVAAIKEAAGLARLLLVDMGAWGRNDGVSVTNAIGVLMPAAHRLLIGGFGVALVDTLVVELDGSGHFDLICDMGDGAGHRHMPLLAGDRRCAARSRDAFIWWAGDVGRAMLETVDAVREGAWAGVEG